MMEINALLKYQNLTVQYAKMAFVFHESIIKLIVNDGLPGFVFAILLSHHMSCPPYKAVVAFLSTL